MHPRCVLQWIESNGLRGQHREKLAERNGDEEEVGREGEGVEG
jgi:hypothetical protein